MIDTQPPPTRPSRLRWAVVAVVAVVALGAMLWPRLAPHHFSGAVLQSPTRAPDLGLTDQYGDVVHLDDYRGDVVLLYFGYTHCPDVCPTTLATVAKALDEMGSKGERVHMMMITVDPERDTLPILGDYFAHFSDRFLGLGGEPDDIERVASLYGIYHAKAEEAAPGEYTVDHTATLLAIDPDGYLRVMFPNGVTVDELASDLDYLLR